MTPPNTITSTDILRPILRQEGRHGRGRFPPLTKVSKPVGEGQGGAANDKRTIEELNSMARPVELPIETTSLPLPAVRKRERKKRRLDRTEMTVISVALLSFIWFTYSHVHQVNMNSALIDASRMKDSKLIEELISGGASVNSPNPSNDWSGAVGVLALLFKQHTYDYPNPFMLAIIGGKQPTIRFMMEHGADLNATDGNGMTPLIYAAGGGQTELCELQLRKGARLQAKDSSERTALDWAAFEGKSDTFFSLLGHLKERPARNLAIASGIEWAVSGNHPEWIRSLLDTGAVAEFDKATKTKLMVAVAQAGNTEVLKALLSTHADPNNRDGEGNTPLMVAATKECAQMLLTAGADVNALDKAGYNVLIHQSESYGGNPIPVINLLLDYGANINVATKQGETPLMMAVDRERPLLVQALLAKGADVNRADTSGRTALDRLTLTSGQIAVLLLKAGAKPGPATAPPAGAAAGK
jgi:ankyrin repeat protein